MHVILTRDKRMSVLWFVFLVLLSRPAFSSEPLSSAHIQRTLNEIALPEAVQISPTFLDSLLVTGGDETRESQARFALLEGLNRLRERDAEAAIARLTEAIDTNPKDPAGFWLRARALAMNGQWARAREDCQHALNIDRGFTPAQLTLAVVALGAEGPEAALRIIDQECISKRDHGDVCYENYVKATAFLGKGEPQLAVKCIETALHASYTYMPLSASQLFLLKAIAHKQAGDLEEALRSARRAVEADGKQAKALFLTWSLHRELGNHLAAFYTAKRLSVVGDEKNKVKWRLVILQSLIDLQQYGAAVEEATDILLIDPGNVTAQQALDHLHTAKKKAQAGLR